MKKVTYIFYDTLQICDKSLHKTSEGYLQLQGIIARSGEQTYLRSELGLNDGMDDRTLLLDRPHTEVTDPMSIASFMLKPITDNHPNSGHVNIENFALLAKGMVTSVEATNGHQLKADLLITDKELVQAIEDGKRELSAGYSAQLEFSDDGTRATQRKIRGNHVAFVDKARCGRECSIFDSNSMEIMKMAKLKIAGVEIEIQDSAVPMVQQVVSQVEVLEGKVTTLTDAESSLQGKLDAANEKIKELENTTLSDADIIKIAEEMAALWADALIVDKAFDCAGKSAESVKKEIVVLKIGDAMKDKSDAYISARFDVLVEDAKLVNKDPLTASLKNPNGSNDINDADVSQIADEARKRKIKRYQHKSIADQGQAAEK